MQQEFRLSSANSTASEGSSPAVKSKRSLQLHSPAERPKQTTCMHKCKPDMSTHSCADDETSTPCSGPRVPDTSPTTASTTAHAPAMSWLPFPALNADVSWTDLADSDDEDLGWPQPLTGFQASPVHAHMHLSGDAIGPSGPLIPSFSGEAPKGSVAGESGGSASCFNRLESPTPVAIVHDLGAAAPEPSRTQFGFTLGSALSSSTAHGGEGFAGAVCSDKISAGGPPMHWARLHTTSRDNVPELSVQPRLAAVSPINKDERVATMIADAKAGFDAGCPPIAPREGMGGTYFLSDASGSKVGIFKPCDEEPLAPNNPKGWNSRSMSDPGMKPSVRVGEAALREVAAFLLDHDGFAGVPPACLVAVSHQSLNYAAPAMESHATLDAAAASPDSQNLCAPGPTESAISSGSPVSTPADSRLTAPAIPGGVKLGSLQAFAEHTCDANDIASSRFSADSVHRVGLLDIRLLNLDRHAGNLLVAEAPRGGSSASGPAPLHKLIPIDHGFALPEALDDPYFEWMYWPQAAVPFSPEVKAYVEALDGPADVEMLQKELPALRPECLRCLLVTTAVLKKCVAAGLTLFEIAGLFTRMKAAEASDFEAICMDAREDALAHAALSSFPSLSLSDIPHTRDHASGQPSVCIGAFPFEEASGELSPQSSLAMSGLIGNGIAAGTVSCDSSPFKPLPSEVVSELPLEGDAAAPDSPCMAAVKISCAVGTPAHSAAFHQALPSTPTWLRTADLGPYSPHSPTLIAPTNAVCFQGSMYEGGFAGMGDASAAAVRRSEAGMSMGAFCFQLSARTNVSSRTVWHSKRRGRNGQALPALLSAVHPDKANYCFSGLSESQWSVFLSCVEEFVDEEVAKGTWKAADCSGPVAGSCPEPVKTRKF